MISRLRAIAGAALCVRYHQNQIDEVLRRWQSNIRLLVSQQGLRTDNGEPTSNNARPTRAHKMEDKSQRMQDMEDELEEMRELLAKLQEEVKSQRHNARRHSHWDEQGTKKREEEERKRKDAEEEKKRQEKEQEENEKRERERQENEKKERERKEAQQRQRQREQAEYNERIRQRAQKRREEEERQKREKEQREQEEWTRAWETYQGRWTELRAATALKDGRRNIRDAVPWPVTSGKFRDVNASNVKEFLQKAVEEEKESHGSVAKLLRKECQKWHPDSMSRLLRNLKLELTDAEQMMIDMICRVATEMLNTSAGK